MFFLVFKNWYVYYVSLQMYRQGNIVQHIPDLRGGGIEGYFSLFNVAQAGLQSYHLFTLGATRSS